MRLADIVQTPGYTVERRELQEDERSVIERMQTLSLVEVPVLHEGRWAGVYRLFSRAPLTGSSVGVWIPDAPCLCEQTEMIELQIPVGFHVIGVVDRLEQFVGIVYAADLQKMIHQMYREALERSRQLDAIIDQAYDGILIADALGYVKRVNPAFCRLAGTAEEEFVGSHLTELVKRGTFREPSVTWKALQERREVVGLQRYPAGQEHLISAVPLVDETGKVQGAVSTIRDMTELSKLREELYKEKNQSERYRSELTTLRNRVLKEEIIAVSPQMRNVLELAGRVANFDSTVLILGESGVGKEVIASFIHKSSARSAGPFIKINCGALPEELLESELFGYEPGAFTGARKNGKIGLFEAAKDGVIFLDEIGEMSPALQVKLLRVLQEHEFTRVGGVKPIQVNCRILAATHRNLQERIQQGLFREDLYYRLYVVPIHIPPLRERREDIPALIQYFLNQYNRKYGTQKSIHPLVTDILLNAPWPGNVRQLSNLIERMVVTVPDSQIQPDHLPSDFLGTHPQAQPARKTEQMPIRGEPFDEHWRVARDPGIESSGIGEKGGFNAFDEMERELIIQSLSRYGSIRKVGQALGVSHTTVIKKMKKYGIERTRKI
jgi:PAS domain S-box-containing protein/TyrR family helix-turn-helix protein